MCDVKTNFKIKYKNTDCRVGCNAVEDVEHLNNCKMIKDGKKFNYEKLFNGNLKEMKENGEIIIEKIEETDKLYEKIEEEKKIMVKIKENLEMEAFPNNNKTRQA